MRQAAQRLQNVDTAGRVQDYGPQGGSLPPVWCEGHPHAAALVCGTPASVSGKALLAPKDRRYLYLSPPGPNVGSGVQRPRLDTGSKS
ncbi:hypothetical protein QTO34_015329 [Cnephaeus nilssonii]|uniref:Uncharacterized protein n=1 Tax=Cnephaeus nilssonii TaxID=3371016 RepID=A0AA40I3W4_CNENI|nr:hypothetical protein QTO34_015329 [Eptesicus nilssonii]